MAFDQDMGASMGPSASATRAREGAWNVECDPRSLSAEASTFTK